MRHARYRFISSTLSPAWPLVIQDMGPWDQHPTVTNDAEHVVKELVAKGLLPPGRQLHYYDSNGARDQILIKDGKFAGFAPIPKQEKEAL